LFFCFISGKGGDVPSIYSVDSTSEEDWEDYVRLPSSQLILSFLQVFKCLPQNVSILQIITVKPVILAALSFGRTVY